MKERFGRAVTSGLARARTSWWPAAQAAVAAALAWFVAHTVLGHSQPFFAPIAAAITLSTSQIRRSYRIVQLVAGVLLGIGVGSVLSAVFGTSTLVLGVIVFVALTVAAIVGAGFVGQGMMFANQAAASAILVVILRKHGTGAERAVDAIVGGGVALIVGVLFFPPQPMLLVLGAERQVLASLSDTLHEASDRLRSDSQLDSQWASARATHAHHQLEFLSESTATARTIVRVAPRRWPLRACVASESARAGRMDTLVDTAVCLLRAIASDGRRQEPWGSALPDQLAVLGTAVEELANTPWPGGLLTEVRQTAAQVAVDAQSPSEDHLYSVPWLLQSTATAIVALTDPTA